MIAQALVGIAGITRRSSTAASPSTSGCDRPVRAGAHRPHRSPPSAGCGRSCTPPTRPATTSRSSGSSSGRSRSAWRWCAPASPTSVAFAVAARAVRSHVAAISVAASRPRCRSRPQIVFIDEPWFGDLMEPGFPIAPDPAIDLLSGAMASVSGVATVGVHCCADADVASLLAAGPDVLSIPVHARARRRRRLPRPVPRRRRLGRVGRRAHRRSDRSRRRERSWRELTDLWCELVQRGCDRDLLRQRSLVTPQCGLGSHTAVVAERVVPADPRDRSPHQRQAAPAVRTRRVASTVTDDAPVRRPEPTRTRGELRRARRATTTSATTTLDDPEITDADYDALVRELRQLEADHPDARVVDDSPTSEVGGAPSATVRPGRAPRADDEPRQRDDDAELDGVGRARRPRPGRRGRHATSAS